MREIKFRAWAVFEGELTAFYPEPKHDFNECQLTFSGRGKVQLFLEHIYHESGSGDSVEYSRFVEHEIVGLDEFTGLKDKNGVDIYEGDILAFGTTPWVLETNLAGWWIRPLQPDKEHEDDRKGYPWFSQDDCSDFKDGTPEEELGWSSSVHVIGNIHEHPDLVDRKEAET